MKVVDTKEYVTILRDLTREGHEVNMLISGNSMSPFLIHQRDYIYFSKPKGALKRGDMVFYERDNGQFVMHRICRVCGDRTYDIIGDAQQVIEHGIREDQIFARIDHVKRKGQDIWPGDFCWEFFGKFWIRVIPLRPIFRRGYGFIARMKKFFSKHNKHSERNKSNKKGGSSTAM